MAAETSTRLAAFAARSESGRSEHHERYPVRGPESEGEGEKPLPNSFFQIIKYSILYLLFFIARVLGGQFHLHLHTLWVGQVPENWGNFLWASLNLPGVGRKTGGGGRGFPAQAPGDQRMEIGGTSWICLSTARSLAYESLELFIGCMER